jgi:hypothetical protein
MTTTTEQTREQKLSSLQEDFATNYAGEYGETFEPHGTMTECNFGGLLFIIGRTGESLLVWRDWSDTAIDTKLTECEIEYDFNEDIQDSEAYILFEDNKIFLHEIMRIQ